jgi:hypothetical protein
MKKIFLSILLGITLTSCSMSLYETQDYGYSGTYTTVTTNYGMYYHQYYYGGIYCPVLYVNTTPYYFYRNCWHVVPYSNYRYITYHKHGMHLKHRPPHNYRRHESRPPQHYKPHNNHTQKYDKKLGGVSKQPSKPVPHSRPNVQSTRRPQNTNGSYRQGNTHSRNTQSRGSFSNTRGSRPNSNRR